MPGQLCKEEECSRKASAVLAILLSYNNVMTDKERLAAIKLAEVVLEEGRPIINRVRDRVDGGDV